MYLNRNAMCWLNPVEGTERYTRVKAGSYLAAILMLAELTFLTVGSLLCGSIAHWIFGVGCLLFLILMIGIFASSSGKILVNDPTDCDWYYELILSAAIVVNSQIAFCLGVFAVIRGYAKFLKLSDDAVKLLLSIDWLMAVLSMFLMFISILAYCLFTTREQKPSK